MNIKKDFLIADNSGVEILFGTTDSYHNRVTKMSAATKLCKEIYQISEPSTLENIRLYNSTIFSNKMIMMKI